MRIGIIDADLLGRTRHRFPNLACMKISAYYKKLGHEVELVPRYDILECYDKIFLSKAFTDTPVPDGVLEMSHVEYGGTGFYYDAAPPLPPEIEHIMPDYNLYNPYVADRLAKGGKLKDFDYYLNYSIGFATRGCIRGCENCVNKNYKSCERHSAVSEFLDPKRKYICLLDDNVLACKDWHEIFDELNATGKRFQFKQGLDERLLTAEKCEVLFNSNWIGEYIFAFDNIADRDVIEKKLMLMRNYTDKIPKFYCFCGFNRAMPGVYDEEFWANDIRDLFERIRILFSHRALPYIMRYADYEKSPYRGMYVTIARWCNQPSFCKKKSFREFAEANGYESAAYKYAEEFAQKYPEIAAQYYDIKW